MNTARLCLLIFLAGGCGALSRYGVTQLMSRLVGTSYPLGTFVANILGCLLFGFIWEIIAIRGMLSDATRIVICVGFMGSFTTFSSLIFDSFALGQIRPSLLVFNIVAQVITGFLALLAGIQLGRII